MTSANLDGSFDANMRHKQAAKKYTRRFARAFLYRGIFTRVAEQLELGKGGPSHVRRVALGERKSPRVEEALDREIARIEKAAA